MFTVCASTVSTSAEHYDFSLKVIQVLLASALFGNSSCNCFVPLFSSNPYFYCKTPSILALILHSNINDC